MTGTIELCRLSPRPIATAAGAARHLHPPLPHRYDRGAHRG